MPQNSNEPVTREEFNRLMEMMPGLLSIGGNTGTTLTTSRSNRGDFALSAQIKNVNKSNASIKVSRAQQRDDEIMAIFDELYDLVYARENDVVLVKNKLSSYAYRPLTSTDGVRLLTRIYKRRYPTTNLNDRSARSLYQTICNSAEREVKRMDDKVILVGYNSIKEGASIESLYWDANDGQFIRDIQGKRCFRRLFDNGESFHDDDEESEWRYRLKLEDIEQDLVVRVYSSALAILERFGGNLVSYSNMSPDDQEFFVTNPSTPVDMLQLLDYTDPDSPLNTFWVWSNKNNGRTNDLLKASSSVFLKKKPTGAFLLVGKTRNGKSTFIDMLKAELGINNTSGVKLTDFDDATHFADDLATTMLNAPDDDEDGKEDKILKSQGTFKSITAHGMVTVRRLYSSNSIKLHANWMNIFPMNDIPQWQGSSKEACMKRSLCISFNNDLSRQKISRARRLRRTFIRCCLECRGRLRVIMPPMTCISPTRWR